MSDPVHVHLHLHHDLSDVLQRLGRIESKIDALQLQGAALMAKSQEITTLITEINEATNEVARDLQALRDQIAGGLSAEEANGVVAQLDALKARLTVLGQDPENPVPPVA